MSQKKLVLANEAPPKLLSVPEPPLVRRLVAENYNPPPVRNVITPQKAPPPPPAKK
jgi:hypothetical protein